MDSSGVVRSGAKCGEERIDQNEDFDLIVVVRGQALQDGWDDLTPSPRPPLLPLRTSHGRCAFTFFPGRRLDTDDKEISDSPALQIQGPIPTTHGRAETNEFLTNNKYFIKSQTTKPEFN
jgi:hypothetical protein